MHKKLYICTLYQIWLTQEQNGEAVFSSSIVVQETAQAVSWHIKIAAAEPLSEGIDASDVNWDA